MRRRAVVFYPIESLKDKFQSALEFQSGMKLKFLTLF